MMAMEAFSTRGGGGDHDDVRPVILEQVHVVDGWRADGRTAQEVEKVACCPLVVNGQRRLPAGRMDGHGVR